MSVCVGECDGVVCVFVGLSQLASDWMGKYLRSDPCVIFTIGSEDQTSNFLTITSFL